MHSKFDSCSRIFHSVAMVQQLCFLTLYSSYYAISVQFEILLINLNSVVSDGFILQSYFSNAASLLRGVGVNNSMGFCS